jgi:hypothetical protein
MKQKRKLVLFVGAGASRACGYPLTGDILPLVLQCLENGTFSNGNLKDEHIGAKSRQPLKMLRYLVPKSKESYVPQITEVLSILDYYLDSGEELVPTTANTLRLTEARRLLERAMSRVIRRIHTKPEVCRVTCLRGSDEPNGKAAK